MPIQLSLRVQLQQFNFQVQAARCDDSFFFFFLFFNERKYIIKSVKINHTPIALEFQIHFLSSSIVEWKNYYSYSQFLIYFLKFFEFYLLAKIRVSSELKISIVYVLHFSGVSTTDLIVLKLNKRFEEKYWSLVVVKRRCWYV